MYYLNKIVWALVNPFVLGMLLVIAGIVFACLKRRRTCVGVLVAAVAWLWIWSMPLVAEALNMPFYADEGVCVASLAAAAGASLPPSIQTLLLGTLFCALVPFVYLPFIFAADFFRTRLLGSAKATARLKLVSAILLATVVAILACNVARQI